VVQNGGFIRHSSAMGGDDEAGNRKVDVGFGAGHEPGETGARRDPVVVDPVASLGHRSRILGRGRKSASPCDAPHRRLSFRIGLG